MSQQRQEMSTLADLLRTHQGKVAAIWAEAVHDLSGTRYSQRPLPELIDSASRNFDSVDWRGVPTIPSEGIEEWLLDTLSRLASRHAIRMVSITTHGATLGCVTADGELALPIIDYTHEPGDAFHDEFYAHAGERATLQRDTATLELKALINPAHTRT